MQPIPIVLFAGYSKMEDGSYYANCSCVLIKGPPNVIIDTMTAWDGDKLIEALSKESISCDDINYVVCTHGHSDHIGCNYLFKKAIHIVGHSISHKDKYIIEHDFKNGDEYIISDNIKVIQTPGHTLQDVSVIVKSDRGVIAVTGDLFEKFEDLADASIWKEAGSDSSELQEINRHKILKIADFVIPGHGPMFKVPDLYKNIEYWTEARACRHLDSDNMCISTCNKSVCACHNGPKKKRGRTASYSKKRL